MTCPCHGGCQALASRVSPVLSSASKHSIGAQFSCGLMVSGVGQSCVPCPFVCKQALRWRTVFLWPSTRGTTWHVSVRFPQGVSPLRLTCRVGVTKRRAFRKMCRARRVVACERVARVEASWRRRLPRVAPQRWKQREYW